jgi:hypothetical protein
MIQFIAPAGMALLKAAGVTSVLGGAGLGAYGLSQIPNSIKEGILKQGPNDPSDPTKFKTNPLQNLLIDEENLSNEYFKREQERLFNNNKDVRKRAILLGQSAKDIGTRTAGAYLADTKEEAERLTTNKNLREQLSAIEDGDSYLAALGDKPSNTKLRQAIIEASGKDLSTARGSALEAKRIADETRTEERRRYNTDRLDQNQLLMLQQQNLMADREDRRLDRQMERELAERRLEMQEARDFRKDRQMAIMQIMKGLQGMGQAFSF